MIFLNSKISKNFAFELNMFYKIRNYNDGITFINYEVNTDFYKGDHNPKFVINFEVLNFIIFEFKIYNVNHCDNDYIKCNNCNGLDKSCPSHDELTDCCKLHWNQI